MFILVGRTHKFTTSERKKTEDSSSEGLKLENKNKNKRERENWKIRSGALSPLKTSWLCLRQEFTLQLLYGKYPTCLCQILCRKCDQNRAFGTFIQSWRKFWFFRMCYFCKRLITLSPYFRVPLGVTTTKRKLRTKTSGRAWSSDRSGSLVFPADIYCCCGDS